MSSANHNINVADAAREDSKSSIGLGNDGQGGGYFKGLQKKRSMSQDMVDRFKDQTPQDTIGSTFAKLTGIGGSTAGQSK